MNSALNDVLYWDIDREREEEENKHEEETLFINYVISRKPLLFLNVNNNIKYFLGL